MQQEVLWISTGECRAPQKGEWYYAYSRKPMQAEYDYSTVPLPILRMALLEYEGTLPDRVTLLRECPTPVTVKATTLSPSSLSPLPYVKGMDWAGKKCSNV